MWQCVREIIEVQVTITKAYMEVERYRTQFEAKVKEANPNHDKFTMESCKHIMDSSYGDLEDQISRSIL